MGTACQHGLSARPVRTEVTWPRHVLGLRAAGGGHFNRLHVHMPSRWSAIYYIDDAGAPLAPPCSVDGNLVFRAAADAPADVAAGGTDASVHAQCTYHAVRPMAGTLWLFPGGVPHAVLACASAASLRPRISLAANFRDAATPRL
jgi:hypothetical protein